jgi:alpha-glucosidase
MADVIENPSTTSKLESTIKSSFHPTRNINRKWWKESIAYQIYPRSFQDSNGDGIGDLRGVIERLDYIKELGANLIWICPIFKSPNDDNGYDISDYQQIMDVFGKMEDVEELIKAVHDRKMRIIFDLVLNHTSDEHPWFIESRSSRTNPKRDWYIWRDGKPGGLRPNNWESIFNGSAWEYDKETDQYYLHLFSRKMPDVNWECAELRQELYRVTRWWLDRGIDGFRIDAISHIKKKPGLPDLPNPKKLEFVSSFDYHMNVEGIEEYLSEFKRETYAKYDVVTVGEANGVGADQAVDWVDEEKGIFNMIFQFESTNLWEKTLGTLDVLALKRIMTRWEKSLEKSGWNALFIENHDKPRIISTWGNDKEHWRDCATSFATVYMLMMGTPFVFQGQEIGMTNVRFPSINDYPDVAAKSFYNLELAKGIDHNEIMQIIYITGRDNARTPMQWDDSLNAGFSTSQQTWIGINPNYVRINVAQQEKDEHSILHFYKRLIRLRKENDVFVYGIYDLILSSHKQIYGYTRTSDTKRAYVLTNLTDRAAQFTLFQGLSTSQLVLSNLLEPVPEHKDEKSFKFHPYEIRVYIIDYKQKEHHHRHSHEKKKHLPGESNDIQNETVGTNASKESLTKRQKAALEKLEQISNNALHQPEESQKTMIEAIAAATTKVLSETKPLETPKHTTKSITETTDNENVTPADSAEIDLENESIQDKRDRQRSLVLHLGKIKFSFFFFLEFLLFINERKYHTDDHYIVKYL